jgi:hypothetical protein
MPPKTCISVRFVLEYRKVRTAQIEQYSFRRRFILKQLALYWTIHWCQQNWFIYVWHLKQILSIKLFQMVKPRYKILSVRRENKWSFCKILISGVEVKCLHTSPLLIILNFIILLIGWNPCMGVSYIDPLPKHMHLSETSSLNDMGWFVVRKRGHL